MIGRGQMRRANGRRSPQSARPGHMTIGTIIKAAKDAGFVLALQRADDGAAGHVSYGPFTMGADNGLTKEVMGRGKSPAIETVWVSAPFEMLGPCRDPHGRAWGKQIRFRDADNRVHTRQYLTRPYMVTRPHSAPSLPTKGCGSIALGKRNWSST